MVSKYPGRKTQGATYIDSRGYPRFVEDDRLVHREIAYHEIYLKNPGKYKKPFSKYQVHHRDGDKENRNVSNLEILTHATHARHHGIGTLQIIMEKLLKGLGG